MTPDQLLAAEIFAAARSVIQNGGFVLVLVLMVVVVTRVRAGEYLPFFGDDE